jgi:transposase
LCRRRSPNASHTDPCNTVATWLAELLAHGLIRASFVPDTPTQELRALLRTRKQLVREKASHTQRLQKTLEDILTSCGDDPAVLV